MAIVHAPAPASAAAVGSIDLFLDSTRTTGADDEAGSLGLVVL